MKNVSIRVLIITIGSLSICGCAHRVYTTKLQPNDWTTTGQKVEGAVYYEPAYVLIRHTFTAFVNSERPQESTRVCTPAVQKDEIAMMPDLTKPLALLSEPGWLASGQLKVGLSNGMLASLDSSSQSLAPEFLAQLVTAFGKPVAPASFPGVSGSDTLAVDLPPSPPCNSEPKITAFCQMTLGQTPCT